MLGVALLHLMGCFCWESGHAGRLSAVECADGIIDWCLYLRSANLD
jgi:hypothetical protein